MFNLVEFRQKFPEFADTAKYPDLIVNEWAECAEELNSEQVFGNAYLKVINICTAHFLVLATESKTEADFGGIPGGNGGAQSSKAVGSASVSFDTSASMEPNAGHWNQTTYGRLYIYLLRIYAPRCYQL